MDSHHSLLLLLKTLTSSSFASFSSFDEWRNPVPSCSTRGHWDETLLKPYLAYDAAVPPNNYNYYKLVQKYTYLVSPFVSEYEKQAPVP